MSGRYQQYVQQVQFLGSQVNDCKSKSRGQVPTLKSLHDSLGLWLSVLPADQHLQCNRDEPGHEYAEVLPCRGDVLLPQSGSLCDSLGSLRTRIL